MQRADSRHCEPPMHRVAASRLLQRISAVPSFAFALAATVIVMHPAAAGAASSADRPKMAVVKKMLTELQDWQLSVERSLTGADYPSEARTRD